MPERQHAAWGELLREAVEKPGRMLEAYTAFHNYSFGKAAQADGVEDETFIKDLIKGKIAEIIFEQMFRESGRYTILHSGYESDFATVSSLTKTS